MTTAFNVGATGAAADVPEVPDDVPLVPPEEPLDDAAVPDDPPEEPEEDDVVSVELQAARRPTMKIPRWS
ncbi:MAG: hypothetical protein JST00_06780 [Deltaproteobacteria bacterium]|nr:hypothetical protein [Deltaproteobacteria bacterium]